MKLPIICVFALCGVSAQAAENNANKLGDVLRNHTRAVYNSTKNQNKEDENLLKQETQKLLPECGVENSDNGYDDYGNRRNPNRSRNNNNNYNGFGSSRRDHFNNRRYDRDGNENGYNKRNSGNRYGNYDNENEENDSNESNSNRNGNRRRNNNNRRNGNKRYNNENYSDEEESSAYNQSNNNRNNGIKRFNRTRSFSNNRGDYLNGYSNGNSHAYNSDTYNGNNGYNSDCQDENRNTWKGFSGNEGTYGYGNGFGNARHGFSGPGYARSFDINLRAKRSNDDDHSECVSQCVFGYLEVLDDNRVPSETLVIKWLQDHVSNDMKRIRAIRETRKCFARLSTSDIEDGCEFSQSLSKCLNLELE